MTPEQLKQLDGAVVELEDEVEYLIRPEAAEAIRAKDDSIKVVRLIDRKDMLVSRKVIEEAIKVNGIIDHIGD